MERQDRNPEPRQHILLGTEVEIKAHRSNTRTLQRGAGHMRSAAEAPDGYKPRGQKDEENSKTGTHPTDTRRTHSQRTGQS